MTKDENDIYQIIVELEKNRELRDIVSKRFPGKFYEPSAPEYKQTNRLVDGLERFGLVEYRRNSKPRGYFALKGEIPEGVEPLDNRITM